MSTPEHAAAQRRLNMIWEYTQAAIAVSVVAANLMFAFVVSAGGSRLLESAFFLVIGFYFGRTNHARIGDRNQLDDRK